MKLRISSICIILCILMSSVTVNAKNGYTYNYDYWGEVQASPDAYSVVSVLTYKELGLNQRLSNPQGLFVKGNLIYICDSGNNRIIEVERMADSFVVKRVIDEFIGNIDILTFSNPSDIFVTDEGDMYICDTNNQRVLKLDHDLNYILSFTKPEDATFDQSISYLPTKLVVDSAGRPYVLATYVNKGLIKYESDGTFQGYIGANEVTYSWYDYIWKVLSTKEQREQQIQFVPTEYDNVAIDQDGFIYAVTSTFEVDDLKSDQAKPIRRLNAMGDDILIKNGEYPPVGDIQWDEAGGYSGPSRFEDVTALENDTYFAVDRNRGRIFGYDSQGHLLYAFGRNGNMDGCFREPTAIEHMGTDLLVLDSIDESITVFTTTEYGTLIFEAIDAYLIGDYEASADKWRQVLALNGNYDLAYIGIGRVLLRQGEYKQAMDYFELKWDDVNYSKAFKLYRKQWIEEHIIVIFSIFFAIIIIPLLIGKAKKIKGAVERYERDKEYR